MGGYSGVTDDVAVVAVPLGDPLPIGGIAFRVQVKC